MPNLSRRTHAYIAFDLGAESGRAVRAILNRDVLTLEEIHRFSNEPMECGSSLHWNVGQLWREVRRTLVALQGTHPVSIGVDAWGVDYALLGEQGELLQNPYHYRDHRTNGVMAEVLGTISKAEIYNATGIQFLPINTIYQLVAAKRTTPRILSCAARLLTIPDLFHYWLTGNAVCEFTNATTTQLIDPNTRTWSQELLKRVELPDRLFSPVVEPGTQLGSLATELGGNSTFDGTCVITPASHDTASAVASIEARDGTAFLSTGTWSLLGVELDTPLITGDALRLNFTNEGGVGGTICLLKNVMGLWLLQRCRQAWSAAGLHWNYERLIELATREKEFAYWIDPDDPSFLYPSDMPRAIEQFCRRTDQPWPLSAGAFVRCILESLAMKYRQVVDDLEKLIEHRIDRIRTIGGGSKNRLLNQLTANATGRTVIAGPSEATALGNVGVQMLVTGAASSLREVREIIDRSFATKVFQPSNTEQWNHEATRFRQFCEFTYA